MDIGACLAYWEISGGRRGELHLEDESRHWDLSLKHPRWSFPAVHWKRVWSSKMPGKAPANCLSLWQSDKCTPNALEKPLWIPPLLSCLMQLPLENHGVTSSFLSLAYSTLDDTGKEHWETSLSQHFLPLPRGLAGQYLATDPSLTCCSILLEHCSFHSYL